MRGGAKKRADYKRAGGPILVLVTAAMFFTLGAGSLSLEVDENAYPSGLVVPGPMVDEVEPDKIIEVRDDPPSYNDPETDTPISIVSVGDNVRWQWDGGLHHSVTTNETFSTGSEGFDTDIQRRMPDPDDPGNQIPYSFDKTFTEPGVYNYFCQVHNLQHGTLIVV